MSATKTLTAALQKQVLLLEDDLRDRVDSDAATRGRWIMEHDRATTRGRTASAWQAWRDDRVTQAAVAWVLATVFVRFCEDNALVAPVWIAGPEQRRQEALDAQLAFFRTHPEDTDREWLLDAVEHLRSLPATAALVDEHSPLWQVAPSGDAASALLAFWRRRGDDGALVHDFTDPELDTRFLGDLYQDLSEHAKATYALLQTPVFVEEFILDRTLTPALAERPLEGFRLIDPTCGSGHFLLGAFDRLLDRWHREAPGLELQARVQTALDAIHGVDLNPFAVAIARFRLTVAALKACGQHSLTDAPAFRFHLAVGDSLLHGPQQTLYGDTDLSDFAYATEDLALLRRILEAGRYDVVVGNPPYITVKDKVLNQAYRERYSTCKGTYALTVPFMERFFDLAKRGLDGQAAGWVGQITSNSFMKREFGSRLIEEFLTTIDLQLVVNSEGAWIPGHNTDGTPTVILIGRRRRPVGATIRCVLSQGRREGRSVGDDGNGPYWTSIVQHLGEPGWDDDWINVLDLERSLLAGHPWSLSGGGSVPLENRIETASRRRLSTCVTEIGFGAVTREDDAFMIGSGALRRLRVAPEHALPMVTGEDVRDWFSGEGLLTVWPYNSKTLTAETDPALIRLLWPDRTSLSRRIAYGSTQIERGLAWYEYSMFFEKRFRRPLSITFSGVATHNHFVLERGGKVFNRWAPVIKLPAEATVDDHLALLGVLNSSAACFWMKNQSQQKGGAAEHSWLRTYEYTATTLQDFPLPHSLPVDRARRLDALALDLAKLGPDASVRQELPTAKALAAARSKSSDLRAGMISVQEEIDWDVYWLYGLTEGDFTYRAPDQPEVAPGERAFEIALARAVGAGEADDAWFSYPLQHATPITEIPAHWPAAYRALVQRRLDLIASDPAIRLLEKPEYKRRWATEPWEKRQTAALRDWLLDRLEDREYWFDKQGRPAPRSVAQLSDEVGRDPDLVSVLALWEGRPDVPVMQSLVRLLADEAAPYLAAYRYKDSGLRKREDWEATWALQRREDAGEAVGAIPVPPKYTSADFRKLSYWQARGKLDVPKERFILYPDAGRAGDPTPLLGWAGWDHAQQSLALSVIITARETDGWDDERLVPLVAGLAELQPWVDQWHADVDPTFGVSLAAFCREQLSARVTQVGKTPADLAAWRPAPPTRGRKPRGAE